MSLTNISFPYTIRNYCPLTAKPLIDQKPVDPQIKMHRDQEKIPPRRPTDHQIVSFGDVEINYAPMFNPLVYRSIIPFPMNPIMPQNRFARRDRDFQFDDPSKMDLSCK